MLVTQESRNNANMLPVAVVGGRLKIKIVFCSKHAVPHSTDGKWFEIMKLSYFQGYVKICSFL